MINLSLMKGIHVDPSARTARAQGGATWAEYNRETQVHGLASTGGAVSTTGIAGLTLGGGWGYLLGKYGLAIDNLRSVQLVLADGRIVTASANDNADLFWAVRGGGGNFGIATSLEYNVHPIGPTIIGGLVAHPFANARYTLRFYRDITASAPDELTSFAGVLHGRTDRSWLLSFHATVARCLRAMLLSNRSKRSAPRCSIRSGPCRIPRSINFWTPLFRKARSTTGNPVSCRR
jgi:FAD/FMN-containing dehydrogenase